MDYLKPGCCLGRLALAVCTAPNGTGHASDVLPPVLVVLGKCISSLVSYFKHNADKGPPRVAGITTGCWADAYSTLHAADATALSHCLNTICHTCVPGDHMPLQKCVDTGEVSACVTAFYVWVFSTLVFPFELGHKLHLHVLMGPMLNVLATHPWLSSRTAEVFEHGFYLEAGGTHCRNDLVLQTLTLWRWRTSVLWRKWAPREKKESQIRKVLAHVAQPMMLPCIPAELQQYKGGILLRELQARTAPLLQKWGMHWGEVQASGMTFYTVLPKPKVGGEVEIAEVTHKVCCAVEQYAKARKSGMELQPVKVDSTQTVNVPAVCVTDPGCNTSWQEAAHCMLAAVLTVDQPTLLGKMHAPAAYAKRATAQPGTLEDEVEGPFLNWCAGKLKMTVANLKSYAAVLGVALVGRGRQQVLVQIAAKLRMDSGNDLCAEVQVEGHSQSDSDSNSEDSQDGED